MPPWACFTVSPFCAQHRDELLQALRREVLAGDDDRRRMGGDADRREGCNGIVLEVGREHRGGHMGAHGGGEQGVAVGRGGGGARAAHRAAGAGDVLDHHRLLEEPCHLVGDDACNHVAGPAGGKRNDHRDRPRGIVLRARLHSAASGQRDSDQSSPGAHPRLHGDLPCSCAAGRALEGYASIASATSTRRPSCAERTPARTTASDLVAYSPPTSSLRWCEPALSRRNWDVGSRSRRRWTHSLRARGPAAQEQGRSP